MGLNLLLRCCDMGSCGCFVSGVLLVCAVGCFDALFCERLVLLLSVCGLGISGYFLGVCSLSLLLGFAYLCCLICTLALV